MTEVYSRRSFLAGVLTAGTLSTFAGYLLTRRRQVNLTLATGADPTGARSLLVSLWNQLNPDIRINVSEIYSSTQDQYDKFVRSKADIYNLDVIHIPRFAQAGRIAPISWEHGMPLIRGVERVNLVPGRNDQYWALPLNTDVGMLFQRVTDRADQSTPTLKNVLARHSRQFVGQLRSTSVVTDEAFVVNVLEHALAEDDAIIGPDGIPSGNLGEWRTALAPLAAAVRGKRINSETTEEGTDRTFRTSNLLYARNWPRYYPATALAERTRPGTGEIRLTALPAGVLGGQSLAVAKDGDHREEAELAVRFLTDVPAQKLLATYGFAPTAVDAYIDQTLRSAVPQLDAIRGAVESAVPRPMHPGYPAFAARFKQHTAALLYDGEQLTRQFIDDIQGALK